jgi:ketosteroid isomerase-like protein
MLSETASQVGARETVERFFGLLGAGDPDRLASAFTEDVDWHVPGHADVPWTGPRTRRDQIPEYFKLLGPAFIPDKAEMSIEKILADDSDVVALAYLGQTVATNGRSFRMRVAFRFTVVDGLISRMHMYEDTYLVAKSLGALE